MLENCKSCKNGNCEYAGIGNPTLICFAPAGEEAVVSAITVPDNAQEMRICMVSGDYESKDGQISLIRDAREIAEPELSDALYDIDIEIPDDDGKPVCFVAPDGYAFLFVGVPEDVIGLELVSYPDDGSAPLKRAISPDEILAGMDLADGVFCTSEPCPEDCPGECDKCRCFPNRETDEV